MKQLWHVLSAALLATAVIWTDAEIAAQGRGPRLPRDEKQFAELLEYNALVTAFREGDATVADRIATWQQNRLADIVELLPPLLKVPAWDSVQFKAAVMMHTAAAIRLLETPDRAGHALAHFELGTNVLRRGGEAVRDFVGPWHTAVARLLMAEELLTDADGFLKHARDQFPGHPAILLMSGLFSEYIAGPPSFERLKVVRAITSDVAISAMVRGNLARRTERLSNAERWLRAALAAEPANIDNVLHLGRVEMLSEHDEDALRLFAQAEGSADASPEQRYLAVLFTGGLHERSGRLDEAVTAYRRAATTLPAAQSAAVALSEALRRTGHGDESRHVLQEQLASSGRVIDPWWTYLTEPRNVTAERIKALFAEWRR